MRTPSLRRRNDPETGSPAASRALVVDDHAEYRDYVKSLVSRFGFEVSACADGAEALDLLSAHLEFYDLLIVDYEMPRVSGLEMIKAVRAHEHHRDASAILLTTHDDLETKITALRLGFDDYLAKSSSELEIGAKLSAACRVVSRQRRLDETVRELYGLATRDELTGLFNRRVFFAEADRSLAEGRTVNLIFFDLDEFKPINDTLGHLAGDRILRDIGSLFLKRTRSEDLIARYGGDEFVMLVTTLGPQEVESLAKRISAELSSAQWIFGTETFSVGVTTGIACSSLLNQPTVAQLLSAGDRDLYKNKWLRKHPDQDPARYEYDGSREAHVIDMVMRDEDEPTRAKKNE